MVVKGFVYDFKFISDNISTKIKSIWNLSIQVIYSKKFYINIHKPKIDNSGLEFDKVIS